MGLTLLLCREEHRLQRLRVWRARGKQDLLRLLEQDRLLLHELLLVGQEGELVVMLHGRRRAMRDVWWRSSGSSHAATVATPDAADRQSCRRV